MLVQCKSCNYRHDDIEDGWNCPSCGCNEMEKLGPLWVNVYMTDLVYGGPEEGGWYYDVGEPIESICVDNEDEANCEKARYQIKYTNEGRRSKHSVLSCGEYEVRIEDHFAEHYPERKPFYE